MEFFHNPNFDFLKYKWVLIGLSLVLSVAGIISLIVRGGPRYGIDFRGGTNVVVKFKDQPPIERIRTELKRRVTGENSIQQFGLQTNHGVMIGLDLSGESQQDIDSGRQGILATLKAIYPSTPAAEGKLDLNNVGPATFADRMIALDPLKMAPSKGQTQAQEFYKDAADRIIKYRDLHGGLVASMDELVSGAGISRELAGALSNSFYLSDYAVGGSEVVGPKVGKDLRRQALQASLYALAGMLIYIAFRFETIYGVAAVIATFHDVIITIGFFSLFNKEITLTVIAGFLTLIGYSMNDTIVVFDRIRENVKLMRREPLARIVNLSINQTLSRTILTSGLTFLTVMSLFLFGGEVIHGFAFCLVVGILIGTYSSIAIAAPIVLGWVEYRAGRKQAVKAAAAAR
ncbi:MAG: protein translocase subunit SecF [Acidobacteriia bacterium]|nr:protein translocase subunit SecF [Terriglobia bacterium]